jgi:hypothetical protein
MRRRTGPSNIFLAYRKPWLSVVLLVVVVNTPWRVGAQSVGGAANSTTAGAPGEVELLVKTFLKKCGRNGQCQDPTISDYYYE